MVTMHHHHFSKFVIGIIIFTLLLDRILVQKFYSKMTVILVVVDQYEWFSSTKTTSSTIYDSNQRNFPSKHRENGLMALFMDSFEMAKCSKNPKGVPFALSHLYGEYAILGSKYQGSYDFFFFWNFFL